ncbi:hypothetical protein [Larkinella soli]|uniref:hypothetical protein n=1 Tax=Larkinella soli TaxID=1770527 RepID=UPI001E36AEF3|nr:hypothetical protein [Larkinella soli]
MEKKIHLHAFGFLTLFTFTTVQAQQTIFNVPSSDITPERKALVQEQVEVQDLLRSTTTFSYGLSRDWEIGLNLYNVDYETSRRRFIRNDTTTAMPFAPLLLVNAQKAVELNETFRIGVGGQGGLNLGSGGRTKPVYYTYLNLAASLDEEHYKLAVGGYFGNPRFLSDGPRAGVQAGIDAGIIYQKLHLLADWISGGHALGQLSAGIEVFPVRHFALALGWQRSNQDGSQGFIVQLTYIPM